MIKINLALKKQPGLSAPGGGGSGGKFDLRTLTSKLKLDPELLKEIPFKKFVPPIVIALMANFTFENWKESEIAKLQDQIAVEQAKMPALTKEAEKIKSYEDLKKEIDRDELTIRTKIETIQKLVAGRSEPSKLLVVLSKSMSPDVWINNFRLQDSDISLSGLSDGFGPISDLMKSLGETSYFNELELKNSAKVGGYPSADVTQFELVAKRR